MGNLELAARYRQLLDSIDEYLESDGCEGSRAVLLDDILLALKLWANDIDHFEATLSLVDEKNFHLAELINEVMRRIVEETGHIINQDSPVMSAETIKILDGLLDELNDLVDPITAFVEIHTAPERTTAVQAILNRETAKLVEPSRCEGSTVSHTEETLPLGEGYQRARTAIDFEAKKISKFVDYEAEGVSKSRKRSFEEVVAGEGTAMLSGPESHREFDAGDAHRSRMRRTNPVAEATGSVVSAAATDQNEEREGGKASVRPEHRFACISDAEAYQSSKAFSGSSYAATTYSSHPVSFPVSTVRSPASAPRDQWFVPGKGIAREVIRADIRRYLGADALVRPGERDGVSGFIITASRPLTSEMIAELQADSFSLQQELAQDQFDQALYEYPAVHQSKQYYGPTASPSLPSTRSQKKDVHPIPKSNTAGNRGFQQPSADSLSVAYPD